MASGYRQIEIDFKLFRGGRLAWLYMTGSFPPDGMFVDHANGNRADDRWENLRLGDAAAECPQPWTLPPQQERQGRCAASAKARHLGSHHHHQQPTRLLGRFECLGEAVAVRCKAEKHYFGDFARRVSR